MKLSVLKTLIRDCLPPVLVRWVRHLHKGGVVYAGDYSTWRNARLASSGYDADEILARVLASTLKVRHGEAAFERDTVLFDEIHYAWPVVAGLMWTAARNEGRLNVLDFGGALGSSYYQNRKFLQSLPDVRWNVVEQSHYVEAGRKQIQEGPLRFYKTISECLSENKPNIILLSSVVQYLESPGDLLSELGKVGAQCLLIDRTPFSSIMEDKLVVQKVPSSIYSASYPMWIFSLDKFEQILAKNWHMVAQNLSPEGCISTTNGFEFSFRGMLLESRA